MIIHSGSDLQSDIRSDSKEDIPSFTIFVDDTDRVIFPTRATAPVRSIAWRSSPRRSTRTTHSAR